MLMLLLLLLLLNTPGTSHCCHVKVDAATTTTTTTWKLKRRYGIALAGLDDALKKARCTHSLTIIGRRIYGGRGSHKG